MWILIILLIISNIVSWCVIKHLANEIKMQDILLNGLSDVFKDMAKEKPENTEIHKKDVERIFSDMFGQEVKILE